MKHDNNTVDPEGFLLVKNNWSRAGVNLGNFTGKVKRQSGDKIWYVNGWEHREDGPAVEFADGTKEWYKNGELHREDGPAVEAADGAKWWHKNGLLHREDGPAVEAADGSKAWYNNGLRHREDGPAVERSDGSAVWWYYNGVEGLENFPPELKKKLTRKFIHET